MGQLDVFSLDDFSLLAMVVGPASTYMSEEIEASIESVAPYIYSVNILNKSKKRIKVLVSFFPTGDIVGSMH